MSAQRVRFTRPKLHEDTWRGSHVTWRGEKIHNPGRVRVLFPNGKVKTVEVKIRRQRVSETYERSGYMVDGLADTHTDYTDRSGNGNDLTRVGTPTLVTDSHVTD